MYNYFSSLNNIITIFYFRVENSHNSYSYSYYAEEAVDHQIPGNYK